MRILAFLFTYILATSVYAQKVSTDRIESDGRHQIMTTSKCFSIDGVRYKFCMKIFEGTYSSDWCLLISSFHYIPESAEVLLKLGNGDIMYLPCNNVNVGNVTIPGYGITIGGITSISPSSDVKYYSSLYELSLEKINEIAKYGIKKIRISTGTTFRDKEFSRNSLGKFLVKCHKNIQERLDNPLERKGLFDDF